MINLFKNEPFISHSGLRLNYKIDCDALSDIDLNTLAREVCTKIAFKTALGIPKGGTRFADFINKNQIFNNSDYLIVDDVATTGNSFLNFKKEFPGLTPIVGIVIFDRSYGKLPSWVQSIFRLTI